MSCTQLFPYSICNGGTCVNGECICLNGTGHQSEFFGNSSLFCFVKTEYGLFYYLSLLIGIFALLALIIVTVVISYRKRVFYTFRDDGYSRSVLCMLIFCFLAVGTLIYTVFDDGVSYQFDVVYQTMGSVQLFFLIFASVETLSWYVSVLDKKYLIGMRSGKANITIWGMRVFFATVVLGDYVLKLIFIAMYSAEDEFIEGVHGQWIYRGFMLLVVNTMLALFYSKLILGMYSKLRRTNNKEKDDSSNRIMKIYIVVMITLFVSSCGNIAKVLYFHNYEHVDILISTSFLLMMCINLGIIFSSHLRRSSSTDSATGKTNIGKSSASRRHITYSSSEESS